MPKFRLLNGSGDVEARDDGAEIVPMSNIHQLAELPRYEDVRESSAWPGLVLALKDGKYPKALPPLVCADFGADGYPLLDGRKRLAAAFECGLSHVPVRRIAFDERQTLWDVFLCMTRLHPDIHPVEMAVWMHNARPFMVTESFPPPGLSFGFDDASAFAESHGPAEIRRMCMLSREDQIQTIISAAQKKGAGR